MDLGEIGGERGGPRRYAFVFPGQGSQQAGMGAELLEDPELATLCDRCADAAGIDLRALLTIADDERLKLTENAQPALCFAGIALASFLRRRGLEPVATAGHSVGEYAALCVAGALSPEDAVSAVVERGRAMAELAPAGSTSMSAVLGIGPDVVEKALEGLEEVWPANFNTPTQTVVAGTLEGLEVARPRLEAAGAKRVLPLKVSAAFHTPLMAPAAVRLRQALDGISWSHPSIPVVANLTALSYASAADIAPSLELQLRSPVRWGESVAAMLGLGCDTFLELGPRRALTGMMRELAPQASAVALATPNACAELAASPQPAQ